MLHGRFWSRACWSLPAKFDDENSARRFYLGKNTLKLMLEFERKIIGFPFLWLSDRHADRRLLEGSVHHAAANLRGGWKWKTALAMQFVSGEDSKAYQIFKRNGFSFYCSCAL